MDGATMAAEEHRLQKLFHELDANKDGRIDIHELTEGLHKIGYSHITEEQILVRFRYSFQTLICNISNLSFSKTSTLMS